ENKSETILDALIKRQRKKIEGTVLAKANSINDGNYTTHLHLRCYQCENATTTAPTPTEDGINDDTNATPTTIPAT
ncbi:11370_t:CDS:1, partial [Gigaspora margarita]